MILRIMDMVRDRRHCAGRHWSIDRRRRVARWFALAVPPLALRGRPLRLRLALVVVLPTLVAATLGLLRVSGERARDEPLARAERYAAVSSAALRATVALEDERDTAARAIDTDRARLGLNRAYAASDEALGALGAAVTLAGDQRLAFTRDDLGARLAGLADLRRGAFADLSAVATVVRYSQIIRNVIELGHAADGRASQLAGDTGAAWATAGVYDLLVAAGLNSQRRALGTALLARGWAGDGEREALGGYSLLVDVQTESFRSVAGQATLDLFQVAGVEAASSDVDLLAQRIITEDTDTPVATWIQVTTLYLDKARQVIRTAIDRGAAAITSLRTAHAQSTRRDMAVVIAVLVGAALLTSVVGYGLAADLRRLRDRMRVIAQERLPREVAAAAGHPPLFLAEREPRFAAGGEPRAAAGGEPRFAGGGERFTGGGEPRYADGGEQRFAGGGEPRFAGGGEPRVAGGGEPVFAAGNKPDKRAGDEIGQVVRAFEAVHTEAIRLAASQTMLRLSTTGVSRTLTRRTQELIGRQLRLITELEERQIEPKTLERLFELDHLATRIRRHSDNLLALTGAGPGWRWPHPASLTEVVQAATAATEQYPRVEVATLPEVDIVASEIVGMIQILAELIDNAARFSPPDQPVRVTAGWLSDGGIRIEVRDSGYGLGSRSAAVLNARLARPTMEELGDEPTLGLHVVALLAARTGVNVHLVPIERGCVATVAIPARLLTVEPPPVPAVMGGPRPSGAEPAVV